MFSCCRANPKNGKSSKKDKNKKSTETTNDVNGGDDVETTQNETNGKKLIIPTITIENGKTNDGNIDDGDGDGVGDSKHVVGDGDGDDEVDYENCIVKNGVNDAKSFSEPAAETETETEAVATETKQTTQSAQATEIATIIGDGDGDGGGQQSSSLQSTETLVVANELNTATKSPAVLDSSNNNNSNDIGSEDSFAQQQQQQQQQESAINQTHVTAATATTTNIINGAIQQLQQEQQQQQNSNSDDDDDDDDEDAENILLNDSGSTNMSHNNQHNNNNNSSSNNISSDLPAKSCLSRHNSTHTSIKKKVNISTRAEIIEPEPLPPPPYDHASLGDDDEVFSDSLPPPKRDSMCAPYFERDELASLDATAFAHGLPEWFNDERINDIGCIEPPVTPVGRDELELRHQRLYADLLRAARAAVEHSMHHSSTIAGGAGGACGGDGHGHDMFTYNVDAEPATCCHVANRSHFHCRCGGGSGSGGVGAGEGDCDPDLKPSVAENLEHLVNRLEKLVERLERSVSARELEIANRTFDSVLEQKRASFDLETTELPPVPVENLSEQLTQQADELNRRIERIETSLSRINDRHSSSSRSASLSQQSQKQQANHDGSLENIPTVIEDYQIAKSEEESEALLLLPPPPPSMSVLGYQDIVSGPLSQYLALSAKIGGDVGAHADLVKKAFDAQLQYVTLASQCAQPGQDKLMDLLKPTSTQISAIQDFREKNRASPYFNHLSAISESIPALGWVCVAPTPGPHVKEMNDAGQFYTNRVLKEWKEKDAKHVEWARAWIQTLTELQAYIKQYHTTGLVWSGKGSAGAAPPPPPIGACPPPPPPPAFDLAAMSLEGGGADADDRSALFAQINQGEGITRNLKKVTDDMQTHKNPTLRTGPAPFKTPTQFGSVGAQAAKPATVKEPVFTRDGKKWLIEYQRNNTGLLVDNVEMNNVIYVFKCENSTLTVKGKVNNIVMDSCKKCSLLFDSVVASVEFVNCQSVQMQVLGSVPTISIDKTDGCQMYLSKDSLAVEIVNSKSSEMNVMLPETSGDYTELALPEQYKTTIAGKTLKTVCVDSLG